LQAKEDLVGAVDRSGKEGSDDMQEETGDNVNENDQEMEDQTENLETNEKVDLYGDE
jgi:hypothetical protein